MNFVFNPFTANFDAVVDPFSSPFTFTAGCLASDTINTCVYVAGDSVGGIPQVTLVDVSDPAKMPAIGVILSKGTATLCTVAFFGVIPGVGLVPNKRYFVGAGGLLVHSVPTSRPVIVQVVGQAVDTTRLLISPEKTVVRLNT